MTDDERGDADERPARSDGGSEEGEAAGGDADDAGDLPPEVVDEAERLTRLAREAVDENEVAARRERRDALLAEYGYAARVRRDDTRGVLVLYPDEWIEDGLVQVDRVEDVDRGVERPLSGPGEGDDWAEIDEHNRAVAEAVAERHGPVHGENATAFAEFMSNHYAKPVESATDEEIREFVTDYFPRNAWPSDEQRARVETSIDLVFEVAESVTGAAG